MGVRAAPAHPWDERGGHRATAIQTPHFTIARGCQYATRVPSGDQVKSPALGSDSTLREEPSDRSVSHAPSPDSGKIIRRPSGDTAGAPGLRPG